jgi:tetratricopeptide (TPR) repeat protein
MDGKDASRHRGMMRKVLILWLGMVASSSAQFRSPATANGAATSGGLPQNVANQRSQIDRVYDLARQASALPQLDQALQWCNQLTQQGLIPEHELYLARLTAWLWNRRGELQAQQAASLRAAGNEPQARLQEQAAVQDFTASLQLDPQWRAFHNRGVSSAMLGKSTEAIDDFTQAIQRNPQQTSSRFNRAELLLDEGRADEAEQDYSAVLQLDPTDTAARLARAHARFYQSRFDEALRDFDDVIRQDPKNAVAYADRADLYAFLGNWEPAGRDYIMAINLDKSLGRAYQSAAWLMSTCPDSRFRDAEMALRAAQRAIQLDGTRDYRYLDTLAAAQANAEQFAAAQRSLEQALASAPQDVVAELRQRLAMYQQSQPYRVSAR